MKTLQAATLAKIANKFGNESVCIVEVQWVVGGNWHQYADKDYAGISGLILDIGSMESVVKMDNQGQSQGIDIKLSDIGGELKNIINNHDVHGRTCRFYQLFADLPIAEKFLLFEGEVSSPIEWLEGDRTLSFSVTTQLEDKEIGFSPEEGQFPYIPDHLIGKPWPMAFGTVENVPAAHMREAPRCETLNPVYCIDPTVIWSTDWLNHSDIAFTMGEYDYEAEVELATQKPWLSAEQRYQEVMNATRTAYAGAGANSMFANENVYQRGVVAAAEARWGQTINLTDGSGFPQNTQIYLIIDEVLFKGSISNNVFTYTMKERLDYNRVADAMENLSEYTAANSLDQYAASNFGNQSVFPETFYANIGLKVVDAGSEVKLAGHQHLTYVANIISSTVHVVKAYKNGTLVRINPNLYTVTTRTIGGYNVVFIEMSIAPTDLDYDNDNIYVNLTSSVGPNTVTIMEWLIDKYTDMSCDSTTFTAVKSLLENYPSHFALFDRKNIMQALEEMAFQSRCAIWISGDTFKLKYLPLTQSADDVITESDIDAGSMIVGTTATEDIVTKFVASWRKEYSVDEPNKLILRHNVKKYGIKERVFDFYIYNIRSLVKKSATFWMIRYSNVWKTIQFDTYPHKLALETFDTVTCDFNSDYVADADVEALISQVSYDSGSQKLTIKAWLPIKFGEMSEYVFAWPSTATNDDVFPTVSEMSAGFGGGDGPGSALQGWIDLHDDFTYGPFGSSNSSTTYSIDWGTWETTELPGSYRRDDLGEYTPTDGNDTKPSPVLSSTPVYDDGDHPRGRMMPYIESDTATVTLPASASTFPGVVTGAAGDGVYIMNVYENGLSGGSASKQVKQLFQADNEVIPNGVWHSLLRQPLIVVRTNTRCKFLSGCNHDTRFQFKRRFAWGFPIWVCPSS